MAHLIGSELPKDLLAKIKSQTNENSNEVPLLISTDSEGFPNVSLLSYLDIVALPPDRMVFAIGADSSSKANLLRTRKGTLLFWAGKNSGVYYVKGKVRQVKKELTKSAEGFKLSALLMNVEKVSQDHSDEAKLLSTLTYDNKSINYGHLELLKELKQFSKSLKR